MNALRDGSGLRRSDWPLLLEIFVERHCATPFAWGAHDCASFAVDWVECVRPDLKPRVELALDYHNALGALRFLDNRTLEQAVDDWGRLPPIVATYAQRGDVVLVKIADRKCLAVCVGDHAAGPGLVGLELVPMSTARAAWRV